MSHKETHNGDSKYNRQSDSTDHCLAFKKATFEGSFDSAARLLPLNQFAFAGRSNVGKSSLINAILNRKIAYVSKNPGKTIMINAIRVYDTKGQFFLIDLPGYGYARRSKTMRNNWRKTIEDYLIQANLLKHVFVLIDARHSLMESDAMFLDWLKYFNRPYSVILTKTDLARQSDISTLLKQLKPYINDNYFLTSSKKKKGISKLCDFIRKLAFL